MTTCHLYSRMPLYWHAFRFQSSMRLHGFLKGSRHDCHRCSPVSQHFSLACSAELKLTEAESSAVETPGVQRGKRRRLDQLCAEQFPEHSLTMVQSWILQGKVLVNSRPVLKPGTQVLPTAAIKLKATVAKFVCRAGYKLEAALNGFNVPVEGLRCLDAGVSTGGFTDCLLQHGAQSVIGVDVGHGQVADKIRRDPRVVLMERTNLRHLLLNQLPGQQPVDLVTLDLSFISILAVMPAVRALLGRQGVLITLIKPQFEAAREQVEQGGVVRDPAVHRQVIERVRAGVEAAGLHFCGCMESPVKGATSGNTEFLAYFVSDEAGVPPAPQMPPGLG